MVSVIPVLNTSEKKIKSFYSLNRIAAMSMSDGESETEVFPQISIGISSVEGEQLLPIKVVLKSFVCL
jgi:hypothetical protein